MVPRRVTFLAKAEYFTGTGVKGWLTARLLPGVGQLPVDRSGGTASEAALRTGLRVLAEGELLGIYPEGTRSPDGRLYRGKTGVARMALEAGVPVIPVAMIDTEKIQPPGKKSPTLGIRVGIRIGKPLDFSRYEGMEGDRFVLRSITDEIMYELMELSGQEYVDIYAQVAKDRIKAEKAEAKAAGATPIEPPRPTTATGTLPPPDRVAHVRPGRPRIPARSDRLREDRGVGIETAVWRALAVFRALGLAYAVVVYARRYDEYLHPAWRLGRPRRHGGVDRRGRAASTAGRPAGAGRCSRSTWLIAMVAVDLPRLLDDPDRIDAGAQTLPVVWAAAPVLAFAISGGWPAGLGAAAAVCGGRPGAPRRAHGADREQHRAAGAGRRGGRLHRRPGAPGRGGADRALAVEAATRGARAAVPRHPRRRAAGAGAGRAARAGGRRRGGRDRPAGRRAGARAAGAGRLVSPQVVAGEVDLRALLSAYASASVTVSTPATPVVLAAARAREVAAAVGAALANVAAHAGDGRPRLGAARGRGPRAGGDACGTTGSASRRRGSRRPAAEGRLGVASSIGGRVRDLGGTMAVESAPGAGTEVELRVPMEGIAVTRVMVVDDHPMWRDAVARDLAEAGLRRGGDGGRRRRGGTPGARRPAARWSCSTCRSRRPSGVEVTARAGRRRPDGAGAGPVGVAASRRTCWRRSRPARPATW